MELVCLYSVDLTKKRSSSGVELIGEPPAKKSSRLHEQWLMLHFQRGRGKSSHQSEPACMFISFEIILNYVDAWRYMDAHDNDLGQGLGGADEPIVDGAISAAACTVRH